MFVTAAGFAVAAIGLYVSRQNNRDPADTAEIIRHARQDIRLIAYLLAGILVMLGFIADRVH